MSVLDFDEELIQDIIGDAVEYYREFPYVTPRDALANPVVIALGKAKRHGELLEVDWERAMTALYLLIGEERAWDPADLSAYDDVKKSDFFRSY